MRSTVRIFSALLCAMMLLSAVSCTGEGEQTTNASISDQNSDVSFTDRNTYAPSDDDQTQTPIDDTTAADGSVTPNDTTSEQTDVTPDVTDPAVTGGTDTSVPTTGDHGTSAPVGTDSATDPSDTTQTTTSSVITTPQQTTPPITTSPVTTSPETKPPTVATAKPVVLGRYNCAPDRVIIYGSCESDSVITSWGASGKKEVNKAGGKYFYVEHSVGSTEKITLTATAPGKLESKTVTTTISNAPGTGMSVFGAKNSRMMMQATLNHLLGQVRAQQSDIDNTKQTLIGVRDLIRSYTGKNTKIIYMIAPNPCTVYYDEQRDYLQSAVKRQELTPAWQFVNAMQGVEGFIVPDLYTRFNQIKSEDIFFRTDTHWSELGAFYAYTEMMKYVKKDFPNAPAYSLNDFNVVYEDCAAGDMAGMIGATGMREDTPFLYPKFSEVGAYYPARRAVEKNIGCAPGLYPTYSSIKGSSLPTCYFMADSYGAYFLPFAGMSFGQMYGNATGAMWNYTIDWDLLAEKKPDYILYVYTDRNIAPDMAQLLTM